MNDLLFDLKNISIPLPGDPQKLININLKMNKGDLCLIRGSNGAGKSTLLKWIFKESITQLKLKEKPAYLAQGADDDFILPLQLIEAAQFINKQYSSTSLTTNLENINFQKLLPKNIWIRAWNKASLGERQRSLLAGILESNKGLYLLDEPTSALDSSSEKIFWQLVNEQMNKGNCFIIVYHGNSNHLPKHQELQL